MMKIADYVKLASVTMVLMAGSCATPQIGSFADPNANHPISVKPVYVVAEFTAPAPAAELPPDEAARFGAFVADYLESGRSSVTVSAPGGPSNAVITSYFGEKLVSLGIPRTKIQIGAHDAKEDQQVRLSYLTYKASVKGCGDWSENISFTATNRPMPNFGCATQHNIAAQVADPRDLVTPRTETAASGARRNDVITKYEKGSSTASDKSSDQSAKISNVGN